MLTGRTEQYADNSAIAEAVRQSIEKQKLSKSNTVPAGADGPVGSGRPL